MAENELHVDDSTKVLSLFLVEYTTWMNALTSLLISFFSFSMLIACQCVAADFEYYLTGNAENMRPSQTEGALMLSGGGGSVDEAFRWFLQKAGHRGSERPDIVLLKAADRSEPTVDTFGDYLYQKIGGCDSVEVIVFNHRNAASDPKVLKVIENADGIYLGGGKQFLYADYWKGTPVQDAIQAHVRSGKPLGGSSAGLAVLGQYCYTAHVTSRLTSSIAMQNPFDKSITLENDFFHLDLMQGVLTDSHFTQRGRLGRLITFLSRTLAERNLDENPRIVGIGIDEKTTLCVEADGIARVLSGLPDGGAWFVMPEKNAEVLRAGEPLTYQNVKVVCAGTGSEIDLVRRKVTKPAKEWSVSIVAGELSNKP
jgi:cyanophycinase